MNYSSLEKYTIGETEISFDWFVFQKIFTKVNNESCFYKQHKNNL